MIVFSFKLRSPFFVFLLMSTSTVTNFSAVSFIALPSIIQMCWLFGLKKIGKLFQSIRRMPRLLFGTVMASGSIFVMIEGKQKHVKICWGFN